MHGLFRKKSQAPSSLVQEKKAFFLFKAIEEKNLAEVRQLIQDGVPVNVHSYGDRKTPLHLAVEVQDEEIVNLLLKAKADVNAGTRSNTAPLHVASQVGNASLIEKLVKAGAMPNCTSNVGCTPLHEAAARGRLAAVKKLLELKADPAIQDSRYQLTAANLAHEAGYTEVRDILVEVMTYQQRFIQNIHYILFNWKRKFPSGSLCYQFLDNLKKEIMNAQDADAVFLIIRTGFKSPADELLKYELTLVRALVIANMRQYNSNKKDALSWQSQSASSSEDSPPAESKPQIKSPGVG